MSVKPGNYNARVKSAIIPEAEAGKEYVELTLEVLDGECAGQTVRKWMYFSEKSFEYTMRDLRSLGFASQNLADIELPGALPNIVNIGVVEKMDVNTGKTRLNVFINSGAKPMAPAAKQSFAARMAARIATFDAQTGHKPAAVAPAALPFDAADDTPF